MHFCAEKMWLDANFSAQQCTADERGAHAVHSTCASRAPGAHFAHRVCKSGAKQTRLTHLVCMKYTGEFTYSAYCTYTLHCTCTHQCAVHAHRKLEVQSPVHCAVYTVCALTGQITVYNICALTSALTVRTFCAINAALNVHCRCTHWHRWCTRVLHVGVSVHVACMLSRNSGGAQYTAIFVHYAGAQCTGTTVQFMTRAER